jgi:hypothetical protein
MAINMLSLRDNRQRNVLKGRIFITAGERSVACGYSEQDGKDKKILLQSSNFQIFKSSNPRSAGWTSGRQMLQRTNTLILYNKKKSRNPKIPGFFRVIV